MSLRTDLATLLKSLTGVPAYLSRLPQPENNQPPKWPAIRYVVINSNNEASACGSNDEETDDVYIQFDVIAKDYTQMHTIKGQLIALLETMNPPPGRQSLSEDWDRDTATHRARLDYLFQLSG